MKWLCYIGLYLISYQIASQNKSVTINGNVTSNHANEPVKDAYIYLHLERGYSFEEKTDSSGYYNFSFRIDSPSQFTVSIGSDKNTKSPSNKMGFLASKVTETGKFEYGSEYRRDFHLEPVPYCANFPAIFFQTNAITNCNDSLFKVDSLRYNAFNTLITDLVADLTDHPYIVVEIQGHTSMLEKDHESLALYRAQLMREILISKGINANRLIAKGYGNHRLLIKNDVIKKAKTKEEKLSLHLRNQRVVYRVISWTSMNN